MTSPIRGSSGVCRGRSKGRRSRRIGLAVVDDYVEWLGGGRPMNHVAGRRRSAVKNLRPLHLCLPSLFNAAQGVRTPFASPAGEQQRWVGSTRPTDEGALRQGGSRERRLGRWSHVGVDEVPCQGRSGRTRGRRSPTSPPQHPQRGTCLHLLGAGTSTSTIAFRVGDRPRRFVWSGPPVPHGARPCGATGRAGKDPGPSESGQPDRGCGRECEVRAVRVRARAPGPA